MASAKSDTAVVSCPGCGARFAISLTMVGRRARCAACDASFVVPPPLVATSAVALPPRKETSESEVPEYIGFECRVCGTRMFGRADQVGKQIKCDDCGAKTIVPPAPKPKPKNI